MLMVGLGRKKTSGGTFGPRRTWGRPPISGKPSSAKSFTGGTKASLPLNHGLTVCWSVDATSVRWPGCRERTWASMTSAAVKGEVEGLFWKRGTANHDTEATMAIAAAAASTRQTGIQTP